VQIIDMEDTVRIHRPVGDETRHLGIQDIPSVPPRRPGTTGENPFYQPRTLAVVDDPTGALPIVGGGEYMPRHAAREEVAEPTARWPRLIGRLLGRKAGA
jgi:hypothetical protein